MQALISKIEPRENGYRVVQIDHDDQIFPVSSDLFWVPCPPDLNVDENWYDPVDGQFKNFSPMITQPAANQPNTNGTQTL